MSQNNGDNATQLTTRLERFRLSNVELSQQLSDALSRSQRLASSLGFRDIYEAQAAIDTADLDLSYRQCFNELEVLRQQVGDLTAQRDGALARVSVVEEHRHPAPRNVSDELHLRDLIPDEIAVDVLPQALCLAHCEVSGLRQCNVDDLPDEGTIRAYELTSQGLEILKKNAKLVGEWEDIFSCRYKDRTSKVSRLTKQESFRFQRALYRIMLVSWLYGMGSTPESDMQDEDYPYSFVYQSRQTRFLMKYPSDDLFEINRIAGVLICTARIAMEKDRGYQSTRDVYDWNGLYLFAGPAYIMNAYRNLEMDTDKDKELFSYIFDDGLYEGFLTCGLKQILTAGTRNFDSNFRQRVLDSVEGADDPCNLCQSTSNIFGGTGTSLRNESSWDDMKFTYILPDLHGLMSGMSIQYPQTSLLSNAIRTIPSRKLMEEIFERRQGKYITWNREDWVCSSCWQSLIYDTIPVWWAERCSQQMCGSDGA
ncbi:hypothetical protein BYT27DRAFT_7180999 [Phlegmacium glaucopus]|nr:hypothetical protein BYT27DRAFT_7180999 [Phlegmacium glaucopus]